MCSSSFSSSQSIEKQQQAALAVFLLSAAVRLEEGEEPRPCVRPLMFGMMVVGMAMRRAERRKLLAAVDRRPVAMVIDLLAADSQILQTTCEFVLSLLCVVESTAVEQMRVCTCLHHEVHCVKGFPFFPCCILDTTFCMHVLSVILQYYVVTMPSCVRVGTFERLLVINA